MVIVVSSAAAARPLAAVLRVPLAHVFIKLLLPLILSNLILLALVEELIDLRRQGILVLVVFTYAVILLVFQLLDSRQHVRRFAGAVLR